MINFTIIVQGPYLQETRQIIQIYRSIPWINNVIYSGWEIAGDLVANEIYVDQVISELPDNLGIGNRNCQIVSTQGGLQLVQPDDYVIKARSDQVIWAHSMQKMYNYFCKHYKDHLIFTLGMYRQFPFHPRDHMFWGRGQDLKDLFNIPLDETPYTSHPDYRKVVRAETYIGQFYYMKRALSKEDRELIEGMIAMPKSCLCDGAPLLNQALAIDYKLRDSVFKPFPPIDMAWPKYGLLSYHYHVGAAHSEYWGQDD
jgi:hypothetical protein